MKIDFKSKKIGIALLSLIVALLLTTGSTIAYLKSKTDDVINTFTIGNITTKVDETFEETEDPWVFKKEPKVTNTGYTNENGTVTGNDCYVRVRIVASPEGQLELKVGDFSQENWRNSESWAADWEQKEDGYYYYRHSLKVGESTSSIFDTVEVKEDYRDTIEGFEVTVYQEAVQSSMTASDGTTTTNMEQLWKVYEQGEIPETFQTES